MTTLERIQRLLVDIVDNGAYGALGTGIVPRLIEIQASALKDQHPSHTVPVRDCDWCIADELEALES